MTSQHRSSPLGLIASVAAHGAALAALIWLSAGLVRPARESSDMIISVTELPGPEGPPGPADERPGDSGAAQDSAAVPEFPAPPPPDLAALPAPDFVMPAVPDFTTARREEEQEEARAPDNSDILSDSQLIGAVSADAVGSGAGGGGAGGGGCDIARVVQRSLQRSALVRRAVINAERSGKAVMLWNGDWVRSGAQDGKGLSGVREAIIWEVAFAPEACRRQRMQGVVLLSLGDGTRFAIGSAQWRWSDLLGVPQP
ncbi:MAG: hypothetical protein AB7E79_09465 [Rhodospirillaceae bacterium]